MKILISTLALGLVFITFITNDASAFVCARGIYRAGCVGRHGCWRPRTLPSRLLSPGRCGASASLLNAFFSCKRAIAAIAITLSLIRHGRLKSVIS